MPNRPITTSEVSPQPYAQTISVGGTHTLSADEPAEVTGHDTGPAPYELLNAALGACTNMTLRMYANQKGWPLEHLSTVVTHEKVPAEDNLKRDVFHRAITLSGPLTDEQRQRLLEIADRCPVSRTLEGNATLNSSLA